MKHEIIEYKGYYIEVGLFYNDSITVQYCGDDLIFDTVEDAKLFIDSIH